MKYTLDTRTSVSAEPGCDLGDAGEEAWGARGVRTQRNLHSVLIGLHLK